MPRVHTHTLETGAGPAAPQPLLIEKIKTSRAHYVYDAWTNEILEIDDAVFRQLPGGAPEPPVEPDTSSEQDRARREIAAAKQQGYFKEGYPEIESFPAEQLSAFADAALEAGPDHIILGISERCNLRCRYCIYSGAYDFERTHGKRAMSWAVAKQTLDWYFGHRQRKDFTIGFYGGEPLTAFAMIKRVVAYARASKAKRSNSA